MADQAHKETDRMMDKVLDQVHKETDKKLKEIEEKVKSVYDTAQKEAKEKLDTYLKQFADEDKEKQADVQAGDMTWTQYKKWRQDKILTGNRYRAMSEQLTSDYVNADKIAMSIVNGFTPEVYAMNYNYGTYEAESGSMVDTSFTLYDRQTVERLIRDDPDLLPKANVDIPKDKRWNRQKLNSAITQGVLQGDSIPDISKRLQSVTDMDRRAAIRNARTMTTSAENGGRQDSYTRAESMGIKMKKQWMATLDSTTRESHVMADGQVVGTKDTFHLMHGELEYPGDPAGPPAEVYNCFVGSTIAYANNEILRSYKHWYDGDLIEVKTAGGVSFSVTPNHPILSIDGWVHANALHEGDNILVADFSGDGISGYPDINHIPSRMDALHKFFNKFGSKRTCSFGVNFHGDVPTSDVEIVTKKWFLGSDWNTSRSKSIDKFLLKFANKSCMSKSPFVKHLWSIAFSTLGNVRSMSKMLSFIFGSMCHTVVHSGRTIPDLDIVLSQNSIDNLSAEAILSGKGLDGLTGKVSTDKIVSVKTYSFHGYVYNLQTKDNYYCVNSIISYNGKYAIAHNCRCTMTAIVDGVDEKLKYQSGSYTNTKLGEVTYNEWKDMHSHKQTSTQKAE